MAEEERGAGLAGTVKPYRRHVLVCTGRAEWPPRLEEAEGLLGRMAADVHALREASAAPPKLTATDEPTVGPGFDLLVFPDGLRYRNVDGAAWPAILAGLAGGELPAGAEPLAGRWTFVCVHAARDERCGRCGPPAIAALRAEVAALGLDSQVRATSHVGGHKYAGNVIVYPDGVWYGHVGPDEARLLAREHLRDGRVVQPLHRGDVER